MAASTSAASAMLLSRQLKQMQTDKSIPSISCGLVEDDIFQWDIMLILSEDVPYYGGEWLTLSPRG